MNDHDRRRIEAEEHYRNTLRYAASRKAKPSAALSIVRGIVLFFVVGAFLSGYMAGARDGNAVAGVMLGCVYAIIPVGLYAATYIRG